MRFYGVFVFGVRINWKNGINTIANDDEAMRRIEQWERVILTDLVSVILSVSASSNGGL